MTAKWVYRALWYGAASLFLYVVLCLGTFAFGAVMLHQGVFLSWEPMRTYQRIYYFDKRGVWQGQRECVDYDPDLIYKPKVGECKFKTFEFETTLRFDENGRISDGKTSKVGIAVLGDSIAMGWGVNDDETFAAVLERMVGRPVYNLAVSSYGTYRELLRLEKSGLLDKIDTVVIQYCGNDLHENVEASNDSLLAETRKNSRYLFLMASDGRNYHPSVTSVIGRWVRAALLVPVLWVKSLVRINRTNPFETFFELPERGDDFSPHYAALNKIFAKFSWLSGKRIIVFYANSFGTKFYNFSDVVKNRAAIKATFVDLDSREFYMVMDDHPSAYGHSELAKRIARVLAENPLDAPHM